MYTAVLLVKDYPIAIGIHHDSTHDSNTVSHSLQKPTSFSGFKSSGRDQTGMNTKVPIKITQFHNGWELPVWCCMCLGTLV